MAKTILYYPTIDIPNEVWVKNTLMYWDKIASIVPYKNYRGFGRQVEKLCEYDCYQPIYPEEIFAQNGDAFLETLERRLWDIPRRERETAFINEHKMFYMHGMQILDQYSEIKHVFETAPSVNGEWRRIGSNAAAAYMQTLAEFAVKDKADMRIGSETASNVSRLKTGYGSDEAVNSTFTFILNKCIPMPSEDTSLNTILEFKRQHGQQLLDFQGELDQLRNELSGCACQDDVNAVVQEFESKTKQALDAAETTVKDYFKTYKNGSLKTAIGVLLPPELLLGVATHLDAIGDYLGSAINPRDLLISVGVSMAYPVIKDTCTVIKDIGKKQKVKKSNFAYIMHACKNGMYRRK